MASAKLVIFYELRLKEEIGAKAEVIGVNAYLVSKVESKSEVVSLVPIKVVTVVPKSASLLRALASSLRVSKVLGAVFTIFAIYKSTYPLVEASVDKVGVANEVIF